MLTVELIVALGLLTLAMFPLTVTIFRDRQLARATYFRAVAMEIVDGEVEVLAAGEWRSWAPGVHAYPVRADAAAQLPPGRFELALRPEGFRLAWIPAKRDKGGRVVREVKFR